MLFSRYAGGAKQILNCEFELGIEIINKAYEKENDEKVYQRWIVGYEKEMSLKEFKTKLMGVARADCSEDITENEILEKVKAILEMRR